jgi:hypothetical protein
MQTFIVSKNIRKSASLLDSKRLGKQRVEAIQVARSLFSIKEGWKNHPAVKMWKGYESYLIKRYLRIIMNEWIKRGYNNEKCEQHYKQLLKHVKYKISRKPKWITREFCIRHQSNLIRKDSNYYSHFNVPNDLEYIWPKGR